MSQESSYRHPQRIRKKNKLFYGEEHEESSQTPTKVATRSDSGRRSVGKASNDGAVSSRSGGRFARLSSAGGTSSQESAGTPVKALDKKVAQRVGMRLRTLLKLPKAHKWVCYEWFYANIDQSLFLGENDFQLCLKENFPKLMTKNLRRTEWSKIRRLLGKPRRCSTTFFQEERQALAAKRAKIRHLQQQKVVDISQYQDLPDEIPLSLVIGQKVTALLRAPQEGLFGGGVDAVDMQAGTYRITFERQNVGTHQVPDFEVMSVDSAEFLPRNSFQTKVRPRLPIYRNKRFLEILGTQVAKALGEGDGPQQQAAGSPVPGQIVPVKPASQITEGTLGGFPIKFLALVVRLSKMLTIKKKKIFELKEMNSDAERSRCLSEPLTLDFRRNFANAILELERLNKDLEEHLQSVQQLATEIAPDSQVAAIMQPEFINQRCLVEAREMIDTLQAANLGSASLGAPSKLVKPSGSESSSKDLQNGGNSLMDLIMHLMSLMSHIKGFSEAPEVGSFELKSLLDQMNDIKRIHIHPDNQTCFEDNVEVHINHVTAMLSHLGNLGAFAESASAGNTNADEKNGPFGSSSQDKKESKKLTGSATIDPVLDEIISGKYLM